MEVDQTVQRFTWKRAQDLLIQNIFIRHELIQSWNCLKQMFKIHLQLHQFFFFYKLHNNHYQIILLSHYVKNVFKIHRCICHMCIHNWYRGAVKWGVAAPKTNDIHLDKLRGNARQHTKARKNTHMKRNVCTYVNMYILGKIRIQMVLLVNHWLFVFVDYLHNKFGIYEKLIISEECSYLICAPECV